MYEWKTLTASVVIKFPVTNPVFYGYSSRAKRTVIWFLTGRPVYQDLVDKIAKEQDGLAECMNRSLFGDS